MPAFLRFKQLLNESLSLPRRQRRRRLLELVPAMEHRTDALENRCLLAGVTGAPPDVAITKGVVASSDPTATFDTAVGPAGVTFAEPGSDDSPFSGIISSDSIRTGVSPQPLNANLANANPGDTVRMAVLLENRAGDGTAFDVTFRDTLPTGLAYVAGSLKIVDGTGDSIGFLDLTGATDGAGLFTTGIQLDDPGATTGSFSQPQHCGALDALSLTAPGRNIAIAFYDVTVLNPPGNNLVFNGDATLTSFAQSEGGANLSASPVDNVEITLERIDLEVTKQVSNASPLNGDAVTWTIDVTNNPANATVAASGVVIRDLVPSGQVVVPSSAVVPAGGTFDEATGIWTVGQSIVPGATSRLTFRSIAGDSVEFTTALVDVELTGTVFTLPVAEGANVQYTVTATNNSEAATTNATGVVISNLLPAGLTFVSNTLSAGGFTSGAGVWDLSSVTLAPGQSESITITASTAAGTAGTSVAIAAEVTGLNEIDIDSVQNNASTAEDDDYTQTISVRAVAVARTVRGRVFLDVNNDGVDGSEAGVSSITVNAYSPDGTLSGTAITDASGNYSIAGVTSEAVRLEFVGRSLSQSTTTAQSPPAGAGTVSSLAFLDAGTTTVTANLALYQPTAQALFVTTCFVYSGQSTLDPTTEAAVLAFNADGTVKTTLATIAQVGATNGLALHASSGDQFVAAFQKRHSDIGPAGNGAIYRISSAGAVSTFIRLDDFFGANSAGANSHNSADWFTDAPAFDAVGKVALGDVDVSADGQFLYTINLATRELIEIPIGVGGATSPVDYISGDTRVLRRIPILGDSTTAPTNGGIALNDLGVDPTTNIRPFALTVSDGLVYVGMVNSAESTTNPADLAAFVYVFDPLTGQFRTTPASAFPLGTRVNGGGWQEWTNDFTALPTFYDAAGDFYVVGNAQPWLTDIEFDNNGDMILGFRDRIGDQIGHMVGDLTGSDSDGIGGADRYYHDTRGEILRLRQATAETWTVEPGHTAGDGSEYYVGDEALFDSAATPLHPEVGQGALIQVSGFNDIVTTAIDPQSFFAGGIITLDNATGAQTSAFDVYTGSGVADITTFGKNNGLGDLEYANNLSMEIGNRIWNDVDKDGIQDAGEPAFANIDLTLFDTTDPLAPVPVGTTSTTVSGEYYFNDSNVAYSDGGDPVGLRALTSYEIRVAGAEFQAGGTLNQFRVTQQDRSPVLVPKTVQAVNGSAAFDSDLNGTLDTARTQRIDVLTAIGLTADGVKVLVTNTTGGFARVEPDGTVVFEFSDGAVSGNFEYSIIDDRVDSDAAGFDDDADGVTDRAVVAFTSGAAGATDHSLDFGFARTTVDLELTKLSHRKFAVEGDTVTFVVTLMNNQLTADAPATGVTATDVLPAGLTLVPGSAVASQGSFSGTTWTLADPLLPGDVATLTYRVVVGSGTVGSILVNSAQVTTLNETDIDSTVNNDDGDRSEDDEDDAVILIGTPTSSTVVNTAQVSAANEPDFDSTPDNDDHNQSEDDENSASFTLSTVTNVFDFGDLPDIYSTLSASGGPAHRRGTTTFLGTFVDDESDGQPSATAVADGADDDGVRFLTPLLPGTSASIQVIASTDGFLNAFIDFDADGVLDELSITTIDGVPLGAPVAAADLALTAGVHTLAIAVPSSATGLMAARFRYTATPMGVARSPGGTFLSGEVEDYMLRQIGDRVWFDHDADGVFDVGTEAGLSGVTVVLSADLDGNGVLENYPTTTDANGFYRFDGVPQGDYTVVVTPPASLVATFDRDGGADSSTAVSLNDTPTTLLDVDFGYRGIGLIGDTVWLDTNANGTQDAREDGIVGLSVQLTGDLNGDSATDVTFTTTTTAAGIYEFRDLVPGNYTVTVTPADGLVPTFDADSIGTPNTSQTSLSIGTVNRSQDFGYRSATVAPTGVIGDVVWDDTDGDGVIDTGEPGHVGTIVQLQGDTNGDSIIDVTLSTVTNSSGVYEFTSLSAGVYTVTVQPPSGTVQTFDADGLGTLNSSTVTLATGATNRDQDFGYQALPTNGLIGDRVWLDADGDGIQDSGESGIAGVAIRLTGDVNGDSVVDVTLNAVTNTTGGYEFTGLSQGIYTVTVTPPNNSTQTFDADGLATANSSTVALTAGAIIRTQDFGYTPTAVSPGDVDLIVSKDNNSPQDLAPIGGAVRYTVTVRNDGPSTATDAVLSDTLPAEFTGATWTATGTSGTVFAASGNGSLAETITIPAGGAVTYAVVAQLNDSFSGNVTNTATVTTPQNDVNLTNNSDTDTTSVTPLTLTVESPLVPGEPFQIGTRGMSHAALVPFVVGTQPGPGVVNGVSVGIADPQVFMIGFVCVDDRIIGVYDVPADFTGQTLYFQSYETSPTPRLSNVIEGVVGAARVVATQSSVLAGVVEGSKTDSVSLVLSEAPTSDVLVAVQNQTPDRLAVSTSTIKFTPENWNTPQIVSLQAVDDKAINENDTATIQFSIQQGSDPKFMDSFEQELRVVVTDNDVFRSPILDETLTKTQEQQPTISWSEVAGAESYDLWVSSTSDVQNPIVRTSVAGTSFTPLTRLGLGKLAVWVRARSASGEVTPWSSSSRIDITTPPAIAAINDRAETRPEIGWSSVTGASTYELWVNNTTSGESKVIHETGLTETDFTPTADLSLGVHAVWVRAVNEYGQVSDWSAVESFNVGVELLTPTGGTFETQPEFTWSDVPAADSYEIYIRVGSTVIRESGIKSASFTPSTALPVGTHRWWVRGFAANGRAGRWSAVAEVSVGGRPTLIAPAATGEVSSTPEFRWGAVEGADSYEIYVSLVDVSDASATGLPRLEFRTAGIADTSYTQKSALSTAGATYRVWIRAVSTDGTQSSWSSSVTFRVAAVAPASVNEDDMHLVTLFAKSAVTGWTK